MFKKKQFFLSKKSFFGAKIRGGTFITVLQVLRIYQHLMLLLVHAILGNDSLATYEKRKSLLRKTDFVTTISKNLAKSALLRKAFEYEKVKKHVHSDHMNLLSSRNWRMFILKFFSKVKHSKPTNYKIGKITNAAKVKCAWILQKRENFFCFKFS